MSASTPEVRQRPMKGNDIQQGRHEVGLEGIPVATTNELLTSGISEQETIHRAQQGDVGCFETLYGSYKRRVYPLCLRMSGNRQDAEDLTQEAFLQLHRKIATFRGESAFSTWLHRLTVNVVLMHLRKKRLPQVSLEEVLEPREDSPRKEIGVRDDRLAGAIDRIALERSIGDLAPGYRNAIVLHDIEGYEHKEIAAILGYSTGNSKSQLHKARLRLRGLLQRRKDALEEVAGTKKPRRVGVTWDMSGEPMLP
jgi:RNA polymerase sigma-70 factor (ECF subfamily)